MRSRILIGVSLIGHWTFTPAAAQIPPGFEVIQLTDTPVQDAWPRIIRLAK